MALTTCPDCGRVVSTLADACPQCGHPIALKQAEPHTRETSRSAVASLVFGLFLVSGIGSILAVIFGHYALRQIRQSGGRVAGHGMAVAGTVLGYVGIVVTISVVWAALFLGTEITSKFEAQELDTSTTSVVAKNTTTTIPWTTTTVLSFWAEPGEEAARRWAEDAIEYVELLNRTWEDREAAITSTAAMAVGVCSQLSDYEALLADDSPENVIKYRFGKNPAQVEAGMREFHGQERWDLYVATWLDSLVNGLCVR